MKVFAFVIIVIGTLSIVGLIGLGVGEYYSCKGERSTAEKTVAGKEVVVYFINNYASAISVIAGEDERDEVADTCPLIADKLGRGKDYEALLEAGWRVWKANHDDMRKLDYVKMRAAR